MAQIFSFYLLIFSNFKLPVSSIWRRILWVSSQLPPNNKQSHPKQQISHSPLGWAKQNFPHFDFSKSPKMFDTVVAFLTLKIVGGRFWKTLIKDLSPRRHFLLFWILRRNQFWSIYQDIWTLKIKIINFASLLKNTWNFSILEHVIKGFQHHNRP